MPRVDQSTINWAVYEDNTEYAGMAQATLPNLTALTQTSAARASRAMSMQSFWATLMP